MRKMRCTRKTVNNTRVFTELNCEKRTLQSFKEKLNPEHHLIKENSPLLDITNFDVVKFVVLDEMHMLHLGVSKYLLQKLILKKSSSYISQENVAAMQQNFLNISNDITSEFQRKSFDLLDIKNWKAT